MNFRPPTVPCAYRLAPDTPTHDTVTSKVRDVRVPSRSGSVLLVCPIVSGRFIEV